MKWHCMYSPTPPICVAPTPDPSLALYSSSEIGTTPQESMDPFTSFPRSSHASWLASAGEAEYAALFAFAAGQHTASLRTTLADMGYPQEPTIIMCDNTSAISDRHRN
jgi:hypothetical protein